MFPYIIIFFAAAIGLLAFLGRRTDMDFPALSPIFTKFNDDLPKEIIQQLYCLNELSKDEYEFMVAEKYGVPIG